MRRAVTERYVTAHELAELMGVSERTVKRWVAEGMPSETWGMSRTRRYLPSECIAWARARSRDTITSDESTSPGRCANAAPGLKAQEVP
jgi:phage terminase Nu1 subunit (DNA packaging protein)